MEGSSDKTVSDSSFLSIQSDWDDFISSSNKEIWISMKQNGGKSVHSKLKCNGFNLPSCMSSEFTVLSFTPRSLQIRYNPTARVFHFVAPTKTLSVAHDNKIASMNVTDKGWGVSVCSNDKLAVWRPATGDRIKTFSGHLGSIYKCRFFPSGRVILSAGADMQIKIWCAETGDCPVTLIGHTGAINDLCIVDRGRNILSVSQDGTAKLWDCGTSNCLGTIIKTKDRLNCCDIGVLPQSVDLVRDEPINEREVGTNNKLLVVGSEEGLVYGVALFSRKTIFTIRAGSPVNVVLILIDNIIIGCQNGMIKIYKFSNTNEPHEVIHESSSSVLCGCLYQENGFFIGRQDGSVTFYQCPNSSNGRISFTGSDCDPIFDVCFPGNNKLYTCCRDGKIREYTINKALHLFFQN